MAFPPGCNGFKPENENTVTDKQIYIQRIYFTFWGECIAFYLYISDGRADPDYQLDHQLQYQFVCHFTDDYLPNALFFNLCHPSVSHDYHIADLFKIIQ
jgi:hypothetical protein